MGVIAKLFYFFTPYTDAREQAVGLFFKGINEHSDVAEARARLNDLLQRDIAVINLWTEYRYKGYRYLRKSKRKKLYANLELIADDFDRFYAQQTYSQAAILEHVRRVAPRAVANSEKLTLIWALMDYFSPKNGRYTYRTTSSFGRLLRDPTRDVLVGDCNQIATLYIYLYTRYYDVHDLKVRSLPGHVALHYGGVDIETTNGTFMQYSDTEGSALLPVEEIVSINLLDTTDTYLATHDIAAEDVLQASRFAFVLSHDRGLVERNLHAAYSKIVAMYMKRNSYKQALRFAKTSRQAELVEAVSHNGAVYEIGRHHYAAARRYAQQSSQKAALIRSSWQAEGIGHYKAHRYYDAIKAFEHTHDRELIAHCYEALFFEEQKKLTTDGVPSRQSGVVKRMRTFAKKSGNKKLIEHMKALERA